MKTTSKWSTPFFMTIAITSLIVLAFVVFVFATFEINITGDNSASSTSTPGQIRTIPTYLALFIFAQIYQCFLALNALDENNTIQIFGLCAFSVAMLIYSSIQIDQIRTAILYLSDHDYYDIKRWPLMQAFLIAIPCVISLCLVLTSFMAYKLYQDFGWSMYKQVGADLQLKRRYMAYLILVTLLKFDFFFFLGFTLQFVVIVLNVKDVEFALTIAVIPFTMLWLYLVLWCVKKETRIGMSFMLVVFVAGLAYFLFKAVRMYQPTEAYKYVATRKSLTIFAVLTILLLAASLANAVVCMLNFDRGLKPIINGKKKHYEEDDEKIPMVDYTRKRSAITID